MRKEISIDFKAPYYTFGELTSDTPTVWIACHGYGQLGEYFIRKFETFQEKGHYGIVLQGLHKFYFTPERVGASWMTRHDRETDLENQYTYFRSAYEHAFGGLDLSTVQVNLLGFSQGVSAISRLLFRLKIPFDHLILWAGGFPPELPGADTSFLKKDARYIVAIGDQDQYYNEENYKINLDYMKQTFGVAPEVHIFQGKHTLDPELLESYLSAP